MGEEGGCEYREGVRREWGECREGVRSGWVRREGVRKCRRVSRGM